MIDAAFEHWWTKHWTYIGVDPNVEATVKAFARLAFADARALQGGATKEAQELGTACLALVNAHPRGHRSTVVRRAEFERVAALVKSRPLHRYRHHVRGLSGNKRNVAPPPTGTAEGAGM